MDESIALTDVPNIEDNNIQKVYVILYTTRENLDSKILYSTLDILEANRMLLSSIEAELQKNKAYSAHYINGTRCHIMKLISTWTSSYANLSSVIQMISFDLVNNPVY